VRDLLARDVLRVTTSFTALDHDAWI